MSELRTLVDPTSEISITKQCELLGLARSTYYYEGATETELNLQLMRVIDELHTDHNTWGSRKITDYLRLQGYEINRKRIQRLMDVMDIQVVYPKRNLSKQNLKARTFPYLLRYLDICYPNQVWCTDITYIRLLHGYAYLTAFMDWFSKRILSWRLSNTLDRFFVLEAFDEALRKYGDPQIVNSDHGAQYVSDDYISMFNDRSTKISMTGKLRALDNQAIERFWRTIKLDEVYLNDYESMVEAMQRIGMFIEQYNSIRPHASLEGVTPDMVYFGTKDLTQAI